MDSGEVALVVVSVGVVAFLAFLAYNLTVMSREKVTVFVRDQNGNIVSVIER